MWVFILPSNVRAYLSHVDKLFKRAFKLGYCNELFSIENIITQKDKILWERIIDKNSITALDDLLTPERSTVILRKRLQNYILPVLRSERYKRIFVNRCLVLGVN